MTERKFLQTKRIWRAVAAFNLRQLSEVNDICIVRVFFCPFSLVSPVQDYIYSKYRTQLTQLNSNTHLKNLASNQIGRCRVRSFKFVLFLCFFRFTRENVLGYFVSLLHEKMHIFSTRFKESCAPYQSLIF